jgi:hypothetical protein
MITGIDAKLKRKKSEGAKKPISAIEQADLPCVYS